ncbi:MAG TPA: translesion error-prone DNA polymerase V autoproteolytic subunit [Hanamia sp.]|jgi:DNA polymerase V|nr:translesion error-prone DNA polymerase V autoproteolytic subunit [Hanamia sp.]
MQNDQFYSAGYKGTKTFSQHEVRTANATGFGAAADDYMERGIDLNEELIHNKPATFFMRVSSDAMKASGIYIGDVVIVDRSLKAANGKVIIATFGGEMLIRRFEKVNNKVRLLADNNLSPIDVDSTCDGFAVWGVVTYVIHKP